MARFVRVDVPEDQREVLDLEGADAEALFRQGKLALTDDRILVKGPNGVGTIGRADVSDALKSGQYSFATAADLDTQKRSDEAGSFGGQVLGTSEALLAGATLGLSTLAEKVVGVDPRDIAARREAAGGLGTAAELAGAIVPGLLTGGGTAAAGGLRGLLARSPAGLVSRLGEAAEAVTVARFAGPGMIQKAVSLGARGSVEGAIFGGGAGLDESVLGDPDSAAEQINVILEGAGRGLFAGLAGGAVIGGALGATGSVARGTKALTAKTAKRIAESKFGTTIRGKFKETFAIAQKSNKFAETLTKTTREVTQHVTDMASGESAILNVLRSRVKPERLSKLIPAEKTARDAIRNGASAQLDATIRGMEEAAEAVRLSNPGLASLLDREATAMGTGRAVAAEDAAKIFGMADDAKRGVFSLQQDAWDGFRRAGTAQERSLAREHAVRMSDLFRSTQKGLESESAFGKLGRAQKETNRSLFTLFGEPGELGSKDEFEKIFLRRGERGVIAADTGKINRYLRNLKNVTNDDKHAILIQHLNALDAVGDNVGKFFDLTKAETASLQALKKSIPNIRKSIGFIESELSQVNQFRELTRADGLGGVLGTSTILGAVAGGPLGALGGAAFEAALNPGATARRIASLARFMDEHGTKVRAGLGRIAEAGRQGKAVALTAALRFERGAGRVPARIATLTSRRDEVERQKRELAKLQNPDFAAERLAGAIGGMADAAPNVATMIGVKQANAVNYLSQRVPGNNIPNAFGHDLSTPASTQELFEWEEAVRGVTDPHSIMDDAAAGIFSPPAVDAVRNVHPRMWEEMRAGVLETTVNKQLELPYLVALATGRNFELPTHPSLDPLFVSTMQQIRAPEDEQSQPGPGRLPQRASQQAENAEPPSAKISKLG